MTVQDCIAWRARMREDFPQHFAMTFLGFCLGKAVDAASPAALWLDARRALGGASPLVSALASVWTGDHARHQNRARRASSCAQGALRRAALARRDPAAHGCPTGVRASNPVPHRRASGSEYPRQAVRRRGAPDRTEEAHHPTRDEAHFSGPLPRCFGERPRDALHQRAPERSECSATTPRFEAKSSVKESPSSSSWWRRANDEMASTKPAQTVPRTVPRARTWASGGSLTQERHCLSFVGAVGLEPTTSTV